ncbi:recombinase family protein [Streptomyces griseoluteus]|uniref:Recombinase family protein n=1 Tax=Streptomyces griseoluteus TaxID=29306 RepID=A0A4Z1DMH5_STRGP|nr:recombinase family protein [Streptomyces griseoluteus]TGN83922.1 recombinase family protein [Streptomyces griseoluteus]
MQTNVRVVGCGRQSVTRTEDENSLSIGAQRRDLQYWADTPGQGRLIVGWALDTNTSGTTNPFQREQLRPWLTDRLEEWDVLAFPRIDRISRKVRYFSELLDWVEENNKHIVTVDGSLNTQAAGGSAVAKVLSVLAEEEHRKIRKNVASGMRTLRELGRFTGGPQPFGYLSIDSEDEHRILTPDPVYAELLREIAKRVRDGDSTYTIAEDFNRRGIMTWSDHLRSLAGKPVKGIPWKAATIARVIQNPVCVGYQTYNGEIWETEEGEPSVIADEPILKLGQWEAANKALAARTRLKKVRRRDTACLLTGIAICGSCGSRMVCHHTTKTLKNGETKTYRDYRCTSRNRSVACSAVATVGESELEAVFTEALIGAIGHAPEMVKLVDPGEDHTAELEQKRQRLNKLESDYAEGKYDTEAKEQSYWRTLENLTKKIAELEAHPIRPRTVVFQPTGRTWADKWKAMGTQDRREFLSERNVRVIVWRDPMPAVKRGAVVHFGNLKEFAIAGGVDGAELSDWGETGWNVPAHWMDPIALMDAEQRATIAETYGTAELPETLRKVRAKTVETFPEAASVFVSTLRAA